MSSLADPDIVEKLREIARLHDEAFDHVMQFDSYHKSSEGAVEISLVDRFDERRDKDPLAIESIGIYSYVLGPSRMHYFRNVDEALETMREWHKEGMNWNGEDFNK